MDQSLIFGKDSTEHIVGIEINDQNAELFIQNNDGTITSEIRENKYWILSNREINSKFKRLEGNQYYKYMVTTKHRDLFAEGRLRGRAGLRPPSRRHRPRT